MSFESIESAVGESKEECFNGERKLFKGAINQLGSSYLISCVSGSFSLWVRGISDLTRLCTGLRIGVLTGFYTSCFVGTLDLQDALFLKCF